MVNKTCTNCKFSWFETERSQIGECRRNPPQIYVANPGVGGSVGSPASGWPWVNRGVCCGEWQPKGDSHAIVYADYLEEKGETTAAALLRKFDE